MSYFKYKPSRAKAKEFHNTMLEIENFCRENGISASRTNDSYYFTINGIDYRVSNHSVESSNAHAYSDYGVQLREVYHPNGRENDVIYIHASKTRIREIYNDLKAGYILDGHGNRKNV